jgi:hypothetical protein
MHTINKLLPPKHHESREGEKRPKTKERGTERKRRGREERSKGGEENEEVFIQVKISSELWGFAFSMHSDLYFF